MWTTGSTSPTTSRVALAPAATHESGRGPFLFALGLAFGERDACEERCAGLKRRCEKLAKHGGSAAEYKEEIDAYKSMLRCSVCNDRPKGVVITRCYHMFCAECVNVRLENRDRKCPGCAAAFSASDVKAIYF